MEGLGACFAGPTLVGWVLKERLGCMMIGDEVRWLAGHAHVLGAVW